MWDPLHFSDDENVSPMIGHDFSSLEEVLIKYNEKLRTGVQDYVELFLNYYKKWLHKQKTSMPLHIINHIGRETIKIELVDRIATNVILTEYPYKWYSKIDKEVLDKLNKELKDLDWNYLLSIETEARIRLQLQEIVQSIGNYNGK